MLVPDITYINIKGLFINDCNAAEVFHMQEKCEVKFRLSSLFTAPVTAYAANVACNLWKQRIISKLEGMHQKMVKFLWTLNFCENIFGNNQKATDFIHLRVPMINDEWRATTSSERLAWFFEIFLATKWRKRTTKIHLINKPRLAYCDVHGSFGALRQCQRDFMLKRSGLKVQQISGSYSVVNWLKCLLRFQVLIQSTFSANISIPWPGQTLDQSSKSLKNKAQGAVVTSLTWL